MSIFNTASRVSDLQQDATREGLSKRFIQVRSKYPVAGNWANVSEMLYEWTNSSNQWWSPQESYFVIDATLSQGDDTILLTSDNTAWAFNSFSALFQKQQYHCANILVSESNHPAQEDSAIKRLSHSTAWRNSVGSASNLQPSQTDRKAQAIASIRQEYIYRPESLSIMNYGGLLPTSSHRITFQKNSNWNTHSVETEAGTTRVFGTNAGELASNIHDIVFYACIYEGRSSIPSSVLLDLDEFKCRLSPASSESNNSYVTVEPSTSMLALAVQAQTLGANSNAPSTHFRSKTSDTNKADKLISKVRLDYANQSFPVMPYEPSATNTTRQTIARMFYDTANAVQASSHSAGNESMSQFDESGPLMVFPVVKNNDDRSTNVNVELNYSTAPDSATNLLLFNQYRKIVQLQYDNGDLQTVSVNEA